MNEPAFPATETKIEDDGTERGYGIEVYHPGLTKLEYTSIEAMKGCIAHPESPMPDYNRIAEHAVRCAKALLKQLEEEQ